MANSRTVLSQLLQWIPRDEFQKGVNEYDGDKKVRRFSCWAQFVSMLFGQLAGHNSLRAIEAGLKGAKSKLYHLRIAHEIRRSTLSDALAFYQKFYSGLMATESGMAQGVNQAG